MGPCDNNEFGTTRPEPECADQIDIVSAETIAAEKAICHGNTCWDYDSFVRSVRTDAERNYNPQVGHVTRNPVDRQSVDLNEVARARPSDRVSYTAAEVAAPLATNQRRNAEEWIDTTNIQQQELQTEDVGYDTYQGDISDDDLDIDLDFLRNMEPSDLPVLDDASTASNETRNVLWDDWSAENSGAVLPLLSHSFGGHTLTFDDLQPGNRFHYEAIPTGSTVDSGDVEIESIHTEGTSESFHITVKLQDYPIARGSKYLMLHYYLPDGYMTEEGGESPGWVVNTSFGNVTVFRRL